MILLTAISVSPAMAILVLVAIIADALNVTIMAIVPSLQIVVYQEVQLLGL